jgi:hypothetical protein
MPTLRLKIQYNKNEGLLLSPSELRENYLFGIPVCTNDGRKISSSTIKQQIKSAQEKIERLFSIKLNRQVIEESKDYIREEWNNWGYVKSTYPISYISNLFGFINSVKQVIYPQEWLSIKKTESVAVWRNLYVIPNSGSYQGATMTQNSLIFNGVFPHMGYYGKTYIPNYWRLKYITGWKSSEIPEDLLDLICKLASINILAIIGSYLYGTGVQSWSVSLDGVSQSVPLKNGRFGMFSDRIELYTQEIDKIIESAKYVYKGITFDCL